MQILTNLVVNEKELRLLRDSLSKFIWSDESSYNFCNTPYGCSDAIQMYESICNLIGNS